MVLGAIKTGILPSHNGWDILGYSQYVPMVLGQNKTGIVAVLQWLGHIGIFLVCPNGIGTD